MWYRERGALCDVWCRGVVVSYRSNRRDFPERLSKLSSLSAIDLGSRGEVNYTAMVLLIVVVGVDGYTREMGVVDQLYNRVGWRHVLMAKIVQEELVGQKSYKYRICAAARKLYWERCGKAFKPIEVLILK